MKGVLLNNLFSILFFNSIDGSPLTKNPISLILLSISDKFFAHFFGNEKTDNETKFPNRLIIRVQPDEGLRLQLTSKEPGPGGMRLFPSELNLSFSETFAKRLPEAYERLLMDISRGNQTLFMRLDEVLAAWDFIDPLVNKASKQIPIKYLEGTMGPEDNILIKDNLYWLDPQEDA